MTFCAVMNVQAQTIQVGQKFWDGYELYIVQEIRLGTIVYMTTKHGAELTLEKIAGKQGEYKLIPSRQADECPLKLTKLNEQECEEMQQMMTQEEPWNAVNSILLNRAYLRGMVSSKQELRLLRNKILAYHGYRFQSKDLQEYFGKVSWYKPGNDNNAIKLDIVEQTNIQLIKSEEAERPDDLTYANMNGIYDSLDENMSSVSRISLHADGTASWCMVGSLNYTEYTYRIEGNTICMKAKVVDSEEECYEYDPDTRTLKNEQGAVYYRQVTE